MTPPRLQRRAASLLAFLQTPRTTSQILVWASDRCVAESRLNDMLTHLHDADLVVSLQPGPAPATWCTVDVAQVKGAA